MRAQQRTKKRTSSPSDRVTVARPDWAARIGEAIILLLVVAVPVVIHRDSINILDGKDFLFGVGVALGLALWLIASLAQGRLRFPRGMLTGCILAYLAWTSASLLFSHYRFATAGELGRLSANAGWYLLVAATVRDIRQARRIVFAAACSAIPVCLYGFLQAAGRDPIPWDMPTTRIFSFLGNPTYLAGYVVLLAPFVFAAAWPPRGARAGLSVYLLTPMAFAVAGMLLACLLLTFSLGPIIGFGLGIVVMAVALLVRTRGAALGKIVLVAVVMLALLSAAGPQVYRRLPASQQKRVGQVLRGKDPSGVGRRLIQRVGLDLFKDQPIWGRGYGTYSVYALERLSPNWYSNLSNNEQMLIPNYAHNEFISVLAETGIIGGLLFLLLLVAAYRTALQVAIRHPDPAWSRFGLAAVVAMTALLFQNLFGMTFRVTGTVMFFWLLLGLMTAGRALLPPPEGAAPAGERAYRWRPLPVATLVPVSALLLAIVALIAWVAVRPVLANALLKRAEQTASRKLFESAAYYADQATALNPYSTRGYYLAAYAWGSLGNYEKSRRANERALALLPGNASVYYNLAITEKNLGRFDEAQRHLTRAIQLMPTAMQHQAAMSELLLDMGRVDEALTYAKEAVRLDPREPDARLLLADVYSRKKDRAAALEQLEAAGKLAPRDASIHAQLARWYAALGRHQQAIRAARQWAQADPGAAQAYVVQGAGYYNLHDYAASRDAFLQAVAINQQDLQARLRLAYSYAQLKQFPQAKREFEWLAEHHPNTPEGKAAARMLVLGNRK